MGFSVAKLLDVNARRIGVGEIFAVARDSGTVDAIFNGIGGDLALDNFCALRGLVRQGPNDAQNREDGEKGNSQPRTTERGFSFRQRRRRSGRDSRFPCSGRPVDGSDEAVAAPSEGFDENGSFRGVAQGIAQALDGGVEAVIEIDEGFGRPEFAMQLLASDAFAGPLEQGGQDLEGLILELYLLAALAELSCFKVHLKGAEADDRGRRRIDWQN